MLSEFNSNDWTFNPDLREWRNKQLKVKLLKAEASTVQVLREKLVALSEVTEVQVGEYMQRLTTAKSAMLSLMERDRKSVGAKALQELKRLRVSKLTSLM